jgi:hydroxymethylpyrimidine/phosphomethylpyrimidine kinase
MSSIVNPSRPNVLSIAGFDPSAGAGILADIKTFEQCDVYGMGVVSALTYQNDNSFEKVEWLSITQIITQIEVLQKRFQFDYIKIGLVKNLEILNQLISYLTSQISYPKIIWDPILKASAGFEFHNNINENLLEKICKQLYLITPNIPEALQLGEYNEAEANANYLSKFCNVYLKGGHSNENKGTDLLFLTNGKQIPLQSETNNIFSKHGSGCVLSSAITANLAKGLSLEEACSEAKKYITYFLSSTNSLLGYHSGIITIEHE